MGIRMGITSTIPDFSKFIDCCMPYDSDFIYELEYVYTECNKCEHKDDRTIDNCWGCCGCLKGYYILPKQILLDNPNTVNYNEMLKEFEENNVDEIYLILS